ncbi:MAG: putative toxin-antitoxin system toxin component, PIN family [Omnitrophica WOR_2 bacterium RIFCSPHIGHO2_02_FULL_68_15]|nr:MAG: putative toxin-antitoxin system toxin component, PIN family [Omnitrophica WOR_2 bacterium RIFCSPHIGHO2_02_FULL_68_15]
MSFPRVVLDTNILVSSLWGGAPRRLLRLWQRGRLRVLMSPPILEEYLTVLARFHPAEDDLDTLTALLGHPRLTEWVVPTVRFHVIPEDPTDHRFLECAVEGRADAVISGDRHLLRLKRFREIPMLSPSAFLRQFEGT